MTIQRFLSKTTIMLLSLVMINLAYADQTEQIKLKISGIFSHNAVLQREIPLPVWGTAQPGSTITVSFSNQVQKCIAKDNGEWQVELNAMKANKLGQTLLVSSSDSKELRVNNILVGDVWLCAGQSNMRWSLRGSLKSKPVADAHQKAGNSLLRLCSVPRSVSAKPQPDVNCSWNLATKDTSLPFTAIGYLFGQSIQKEVGVPIGIINGSWGGTYIEQWMPSAVVKAREDCQKFIKKVHEKRKVSADFSGPGGHFNGMIRPIAPYGLKGILWYQGEGNVYEFSTYKHKISSLIANWRSLFKSPKLPFIMTTLAPYGVRKNKPIDSAQPRFAEGLYEVEQTSENAWVITIPDGGMQKEIHPPFKEIPAKRFTAMALAKVYNKPGVYKGPVFKSWKAEGDKAIVKFDSVGKGLVAKTLNLDGHEVSKEMISGFEIVDESQIFYPANAVIEGKDTIILSHPAVKKIIAVRYAWSNFPLGNLYNQEYFAAYPFRTDNWAWQTPK